MKTDHAFETIEMNLLKLATGGASPYLPKPLGKHYDPYFANYGLTGNVPNAFGRAYLDWISHYGKNAYVDWTGF